jgi:hypothetical protein
MTARVCTQSLPRPEKWQTRASPPKIKLLIFFSGAAARKHPDAIGQGVLEGHDIIG